MEVTLVPKPMSLPDITENQHQKTKLVMDRLPSSDTFGGQACTDKTGQHEMIDFYSMKICTCCRDKLMTAFDHCLSQEGISELNSNRRVDEEADGIPSSEQPYFDRVKMPEPLEFRNDASSKIARSQWILKESKKTFERQAKDCQKKNSTEKESKLFSGAIYKRILEAKDREIANVRGQLYDAIKKSESENTNIHKLKVALNKSVHYYTFAEEWQAKECKRLQNDIKNLKQDISALMAHLINAEDHKRRVI
jgi:hypothetical protein